MRVIAAPDWQTLLARNPERFGELLRDPHLQARLRNLADSAKGYLHWTKFRHLTRLPDGIEPEEAWALVAFQRTAGARPLPFHTVDGSPISINVTDPLRAAAHRITRHRPLLQAGLPERPDPGVREDVSSYFLKALVDEAYFSAVIEGAVTTRRDARRMIREEREPKSRSEWMIMNNYNAGRRMSSWVKQPLTPELLSEIQGIVTRGTLSEESDSGRFRISDDIFVVDSPSNEIVHVPPRSAELDGRVQLICDFANEDEGDDRFLHPLIKSALLHYQIAYDHPFADGNGRTARWVALWFLLRLPEYWWFAMLAISRMTSHDRASYYAAFQFAASDGGDATYLVRHQVAAAEKEMEQFARFFAGRQELLAKARRSLRLEDRLSIRQLALVDHALKRRGDAEYTQIGHKQYHAVSHKTARSDLEELVGLGLLERKEGRPIRYRPTPRLLSIGG